MEKIVSIDTYHLLNIMDEASKLLNEKISERFKMISNNSDLKKEISLLVRESFKETRNNLRYFSEGRQSFSIQMIKE